MLFWVVFKKEMKSYLSSPLYYVLAFMFTLFLSSKFYSLIFNFSKMSAMPAGVGGEGNIHLNVFMVHLNLVYLVMLFLTPLLTMKLFAEEKKDRTLDLLLTAPISSAQIVIGKFLASWFAVGALLFLALLYPLFTGLIVDFDYAPLWGSYLGMFLMLGVNCSIGLFASSLTSSALMASFLGLLMVLTVMLSGSMAGNVTHPFWSILAEQLSLVLHMQDFFNGTIEISALMFLVSTLMFFCFLTQRVLESSRWR